MKKKSGEHNRTTLFAHSVSKRKQSKPRRGGALGAMNDALDVLRQHDEQSLAPHVRDRDFLAEITNNRVDAARAGDTDAARKILRDYISAVEQRTEKIWRGPNHYVYARYISDAFRRILDGHDAAVALGIKSSKSGRRRGVRTHDTNALHAAYQLLIRSGRGPEQATLILAKFAGADRTTIQEARKAPDTSAYKFPELMGDDKLKAIVQAGPYGEKLLKVLTAE